MPVARVSFDRRLLERQKAELLNPFERRRVHDRQINASAAPDRARKALLQDAGQQSLKAQTEAWLLFTKPS